MLEKNSTLLTLLFCLAVFGSVLFNTGAFVEKRFENRVIPGLLPTPTARPALTRRVALVLLDDVGLETASRNLPLIRDKAGKSGFFTRMTLDSFTFTIAGVYTLGTGDRPTLLQIKDDFLTEESEANNIFENVRQSGGGTFVLGEALWRDMYGRGLSGSFTRRDLGPHLEYGSDEMFTRFGAALEDEKNRLVVLHLGEVGHVSHQATVRGARLISLLNQLDRRIVDVAGKHARGITWLVGSDHGTTDDGQHGGVSRKEQTTFLAAWGPGIAHRPVASIPQVEVTNALSLLLGVPFTTQSNGLLPDIFDGATPDLAQRARQELLAQKKTLYGRLLERYGDREAVDWSDLASLNRGISRIKAGVDSPLLLGAYVALFLAVVALWALQLGGGIRWQETVVALSVFALARALPPGALWLAALLPLPLIALGAARLSKTWWRNALGAGLPAASAVALFYLFPSRIYVGQSEAVRLLVVSAAIGLTLLAMLVSGFFARRPLAVDPGARELAMWGIAGTFVVATPLRYYQYLIPLGFLVLAGVAAFHRSEGRRGFVAALLRSLLFWAPVLFLGFAQLPGSAVGALKPLGALMKESSLGTEALLFAGLAIFGFWLNRCYRGSAHPALRWGALAAVVLLHGLYHLRWTEANAVLLSALGGALALQLWLRSRESGPSRDYWNVSMILTIMTQQQSALELVAAMAGALVLRHLLEQNPYAEDRLRHHAYAAFALVVYCVYFLTAKGHQLVPSQVMLFKGFVGFNMPLVFLVSIALVCFYYVQPILLAWFVARATGVRLAPFYRTGVIASSLLYLELAFTSALFSFSVLPSGDYTRGLAGGVLLLDFGSGLLLASGISLVLSRRQRGEVT